MFVLVRNNTKIRIVAKTLDVAGFSAPELLRSFCIPAVEFRKNHPETRHRRLVGALLTSERIEGGKVGQNDGSVLKSTERPRIDLDRSRVLEPCPCKPNVLLFGSPLISGLIYC